jgi:hypothetical protein
MSKKRPHVQIHVSLPQAIKRIVAQAEQIQACKTAEFVVYKDGYSTESEELLSPPRAWWTLATFRPRDESIVHRHVLFDEELMWRLLNAGRNVLLSGSAGSGKSHLIKRFLEHCVGATFAYRVTGPTAYAALNIGGETLHRALGCGLASDPVDELLHTIKRYRHSGKQSSWDFLTRTQLLVIDEVSMVQPSFFRKLDWLMRSVRGRPNEAFGGCRLLMMGDFTQLGPIEDKKTGETARFVFQTDTWQALDVARIFLDRNYRQGEGQFAQLLDRLRIGQMTPDDMAFLTERANAAPSAAASIQLDLAHSDDCSICLSPLSVAARGQPKTLDCGHVFHIACISTWVEQHSSCPLCRGEVRADSLVLIQVSSIVLYPRIDDVDKYNRVKLVELLEHGSVKHTISAFINVVDKADGDLGPRAVRRPDLVAEALKYLNANFQKIDSQFPVDRVLTLAVGAQVMMRCNRYVDRGVCNGSVGIVASISDNIITAKFEGRLGAFVAIEVERTLFDIKYQEHVGFQMSQFPLALAWASTIHKSQGATFERLTLDARRCFANGQLYVALSRVRTPEGLQLLGFDPRSQKTDAEAVQFEVMEESRRAHYRARYENGHHYPVGSLLLPAPASNAQ